MSAAIRELAEHGHRVVLIYPIPEVGWRVPRMLTRLLRDSGLAEMRRKLAEQPITTSLEVYTKRSSESFALLDSVKHPNIFRVYPHKLFCETRLAGRCVTHNDTHAFYRDDNHLSDTGAELLTRQIVATAAFKKR